MRTFDMDQTRAFLHGLSHGGAKEVTHAMLFEALGLTDEPAKARLRKRLQDLVKRGELKRLEPGRYSYHPQREVCQGKSFERIWRGIRAQRSGWTFTDIAQVTRISYTQVRRYCHHLEEEGLIERFGKEGRTLRWRTTRLGRETRETPFPPREINDPFEAQRSAALRLVRVFLEMDPYSAAARRRIQENCQILMDRFGENESE